MRKSLIVLLCVLLLGSHVQAAPEVAAPSAILMDAATGTILFEKNAHERLAPASVTKVMTLLLVMEALESGRISFDDRVIASEVAAAKGGSQVYLEVGEAMTMDELLKSVVVSSANDCATALAEHIAGSEGAFVEMMNQRAAELQMNDTHFVNCTGLDDEPEAAQHLTSAYDIAIMSRELLRHDLIRNYTTIWMDTVRNGRFGLSNTNKLVRFYEGTTGLKTGYTSTAGHCLAASAMREGMELIAVVLHCGSSADRFESAKALLNYGFANYALISCDVPQALGTVQVRLGKQTLFTPVLQSAAPILVSKSELAQVEKRVTMEQELTAPVEKGQTLGSLTITAGERVLAEIPIVSPVSIPKLSLWQLTTQILRRLCMATSP